MRTRTALVLLALVLAAGCGGDDDDATDADTDAGAEALGDGAAITYHYIDASVPPDVQRNYSFVVTSEEIQATVDSYGDLIDEATVETPTEVWAALSDTSQPALTVEADSIPEGCTGGTGRHLLVNDSPAFSFEAGFDVCGGVNEEQAEAVDAYIEPVTEAIPEWESMITP
jgi:hypothetical protein